MRNKKGFASGIISMLLWSSALIFIILLIWAGSIILPIVVPTIQEVGSTANLAIQGTNDPGLQQAANASIVPATNSLNNMEWISYTLIILMFLAFLVMCFYVRTYPFLMWVWILMILIMIFVSLYLTVAYQDLSADPQLGAYYQAWENTDFILKNLPAIVFIVGIIGGIIMFMLSNRDTAAEQVGGGAPL